MHKIKSQRTPKIFQNMFRQPTHKNTTNLFVTNYSILLFKLSKSKGRTSVRGPTLSRSISNWENTRKCNHFEIFYDEEKASGTWKKIPIFKLNCSKS